MSLDPLGALRAVVQAVSETGISYAVIGAVARNAWAPPRATTDLDCAVSLDAGGYASLLDALARRGFSLRKTVVADPNDSIPDVVLLDNPPMLVRRTDLLVAKTPFEREAVAQAVSRDVGVECRVVRPEHLIVYKLIANRVTSPTQRRSSGRVISPASQSISHWSDAGRWTGASTWRSMTCCTARGRAERRGRGGSARGARSSG